MEFVDAWNTFYGRISDVGVCISCAISVVAFTLLYYLLMNIARRNNSSVLIFIISIIIVVSGVAFVFNSELDGVFFFIFPLLICVVIIQLFSVEIKRAIWAKKRLKDVVIKHDGDIVDEENVKRCIEEIIKALQDMAKNDVGALIVLSTGNVPAQILDSGVSIMSDISSELIESIFFPKTPLHDGAMIINGTKIISAGCFLPLSQKIDTIQKDLGTRHRAGMGITENIDVVSLIVSEETGIISVAKGGNITRFVDAKMLNSILSDYFWQEIEGIRK